MNVEARLRAAAGDLEPPFLSVPPFERVRRRRRRRRAGVALASALAVLVAGAVALSSATDRKRFVTAPPETSEALPPRTAAALGLTVEMPSGWSLRRGTCPLARTVTVIDSVSAQPVPAGCPTVDEPWVVIQRTPHDLDGIDTACGPGFIDHTPFCQAIEAGTLTERRFYHGLDVLVTIHRTVAGGPSDRELTFRYTDPTMNAAERTAARYFPQPVVIAGRAVALWLQTGCAAFGDERARQQCDALTVPTNGRVTEAQEASAGGSVPAEYVVVSVDSDGGPVRYRVLVQNRWDPAERSLAALVTSVEVYDGPWPNPPCTEPPSDERFVVPDCG